MTKRRPLDPRLAAVLAAQRQSRRRFLGNGLAVVGGVVVGPTLLAACGGDDDDGGGGSAGTGGSGGSGGAGAGDSLRISNWPLYMAPGFNEAFTEATGIKVAYDENFQDNETWFAANKDALAAGQDIGADLVVPTDFMTGRLISLEFLAELDEANLPNKANVRADLLELAADPGLRYSLPYFSGMLGIAYNKSATGREITSVDDLWDPAFKGKVSMFSDMRDALGMIMMHLGKDPAEATEADVQAAADLVAEQNDAGQIRRFTGNDYGDDLTSGNVIVAQVYSGDVAQLQEDNPDLEFVVPEAGTTQFVDTMAVPITSKNKAGAEAWMNYVYDKANYAQLVAEVQYIPVLADMTEALEAVDPDLASNPLVNPPDDVLSRLTSWRTLSDEEDQAYAAIYAEITGG